MNCSILLISFSFYFLLIVIIPLVQLSSNLNVLVKQTVMFQSITFRYNQLVREKQTNKGLLLSRFGTTSLIFGRIWHYIWWLSQLGIDWNVFLSRIIWLDPKPWFYWPQAVFAKMKSQVCKGVKNLDQINEYSMIAMNHRTESSLRTYSINYGLWIFVKSNLRRKNCVKSGNAKKD